MPCVKKGGNSYSFKTLMWFNEERTFFQGITHTYVSIYLCRNVYLRQKTYRNSHPTEASEIHTHDKATQATPQSYFIWSWIVEVIVQSYKQTEKIFDILQCLRHFIEHDSEIIWTFNRLWQKKIIKKVCLVQIYFYSGPGIREIIHPLFFSQLQFHTFLFSPRLNQVKDWMTPAHPSLPFNIKH